MTFSDALAALWPKSKYIYKAFARVAITVISSSYLFVNSAFAQSRPEGGAGVKVIQSYKVGDRLPEDFWLQEHLFDQGGITTRQALRDFQDKLLILDFWASWCGPCLAAFPAVDYLDNEFSEVSFVKVTRDRQSINNVKSIIADSLLSTYFPHRIIPHFVWISPAGGEVVAITSTDKISAEHIRQMLGSPTSNIQDKYDLDYSKPLFLNLPDSTRVVNSYSALVKGVFKGLPSAVNFRLSNPETIGFSITNRSLGMIYRTLARGLLLQIDSSYIHNPLIVDIAGSNALKYGLQLGHPGNDVYSYDIEVDRALQPQLYEMALSDINSRTDFYGEIQWRNQLALQLVVIGDTSQLFGTKPPKREIVNAKSRTSVEVTCIKKLVNFWNQGSKLGMLVVDSTNIQHPIFLQIDSSPNLLAINDQLLAYGLKLIKRKVDVPVFVVRDKKYPAMPSQ